jgi:hypothetical protein
MTLWIDDHDMDLIVYLCKGCCDEVHSFILKEEED